MLPLFLLCLPYDRFFPSLRQFKCAPNHAINGATHKTALMERSDELRGAIGPRAESRDGAHAD